MFTSLLPPPSENQLTRLTFCRINRRNFNQHNTKTNVYKFKTTQKKVNWRLTQVN